MRKLFVIVGAVALALLVPAVLVPAAAGAHGDEGEMTVTLAESAATEGSPAVRIEVGVVYANDADLAEEATVSVTLTAATGEVVGPASLPRIEGARYGATVTVPVAGTWSAAVTSTGPTAAAEATVEVVEPDASTTSGDGDPSPGSTASTDAVPAAEQSTAPGAAGGSTGDDDGGSWPVLVLVGVAVLAVGAGGLWRVRSRARARG